MALDIESIKAKHAATQKALQDSKDAQAARERSDAELIANVAAEWPIFWNTLQLVVNKIDSEIQSSGLSLSATSIDQRDASELAQVTIDLIGTTQEKKLIFNVGLRGRIRPVLLVPHTGPSRNAFFLREADATRLQEEILFFLDEAVSRA